MNKIDIFQTIKEIKKSDFFKQCAVPMGYVEGLPLLKIVNSKLCLVIPFLRYKVTGEVDKTLVYPVKYVFTVSLPDKRIVGLEDLGYNSTFRKVDFGKPIGFFRHDAVKGFTRSEYKQKRAELFEMYSEVASSIIYNTPYSGEKDKEFKKLLNIMLEPSVKPIYKALDRDFYEKYLNER